MKYEIILLRTAIEDLDGIYDYIAYDLKSPRSAEAQLARIEEEIATLDQMPERYRRYDGEPWRSRNIHIVNVDNFCILYAPDNERKIVSILHVVYGGRDIDRVLAEHEGSVN